MFQCCRAFVSEVTGLIRLQLAGFLFRVTDVSEDKERFVDRLEIAPHRIAVALQHLDFVANGVDRLAQHHIPAIRHFRH